MKMAAKNQGKTVEAFVLGNNSEMEQKMIAEGKLADHGDGTYELFSQESVNGKGEIAHDGDYFKVDNAGYPYPNGKDWFEQNHRHIEGDTYEQIPQPLPIYQVEDPIPEEVQWLIDNGKLQINPDDPTKYFNAELWGAPLSAAMDATLVIYGTTKDDAGNITDVDFNLVASDEFEKTYHLVEEPVIEDNKDHSMDRIGTPEEKMPNSDFMDKLISEAALEANEEREIRQGLDNGLSVNEFDKPSLLHGDELDKQSLGDDR